MKEKHRHKYEQMLKDIEQSEQSASSKQKHIERCFQICWEYWNFILQEELAVQRMSITETISFRKYTKPMFALEMEYYILLYYALLFQPSDDLAELKKFWIREANRFSEMVKEYKDFYVYYESGDSHWDEEYFAGESTGKQERVLTNLLALKKYKEYVLAELRQLKHIPG